ncbi:MAG: serine hydroxymethyltransferase [Rhodospirillaceae bacterium]|nr:serine hydroxymethyltransferase [Rhodospirillaceae bacterium]
MSESKRHFREALAVSDPELGTLLDREKVRQRDTIDLIASENAVSRAVHEAEGSLLTNKTVEGYPGRRYHGGAAVADAVERLAIERAVALFGCAHANVQPHSGSQANQTAYLALLEPGDRILSMDLAAGGHLSHGAKVNQTGKLYDVARYGVGHDSERIEMDEVARIARDHRPKLILAGGSAYPRAIDFEAFRGIADEVGAVLMVDIAHIAGLIAGGAHPSPFPYADVVTTSTYKTLRGPRGGLVLTDDPGLAKRIDSALFPGLQGTPSLQAIAAKAACFGEALRPAFRDYARAVVDHAGILGQVLRGRGYRLVSDGTDTSMILLDLRPQGMTGRTASDRLEAAGLICNMNAVPLDPERPTVTSGLRLSSNTGTTRGFDGAVFERVGGLVADVLDELAADPDGAPGAAFSAAREAVAEICAAHPFYETARYETA